MSPRSEPLLWLQLVALGAIPLELELLRLVLAGSDLGPVPSLERLLCWGIGVVAPAVLLWRKPADWGSLLLVRHPISERNTWQRKLSRYQENLFLKLICAAGAVLLLALFWWIDRSSILIADLSPITSGQRLNSLLIATPLLAVILWQWHQLMQTIWLLTRSTKAIEGALPMNELQLEQSRLSLGLNLLRLKELEWDDPKIRPATVDERNTTPNTDLAEQSPQMPKQESSEQNTLSKNEEEQVNATEASGSVATSSIQPEQASKHSNSTDLNHEITDNKIASGSDSEGHNEQTKTTGGKESDPEETP